MQLGYNTKRAIIKGPPNPFSDQYYTIIYTTKNLFSDRCFFLYIEFVSLPGEHKRCTLLQVEKAHNWSEL